MLITDDHGHFRAFFDDDSNFFNSLDVENDPDVNWGTVKKNLKDIFGFEVYF